MQDDESVISAIRRVPLSFSSLYCVFYPHRSLVKARPNLTVHGSATVALYPPISVCLCSPTSCCFVSHANRRTDVTFPLLLIIVISWLSGQARALATTSLSFRKHTWFFDPPPFPVIRLWLHIRRFNNIGCDFRIGVVRKIFQYLSCEISFSECAIDGHFYPNS